VAWVEKTTKNEPAPATVGGIHSLLDLSGSLPKQFKQSFRHQSELSDSLTLSAFKRIILDGERVVWKRNLASELTRWKIFDGERMEVVIGM
jgi:hypothetical protein